MRGLLLLGLIGAGLVACAAMRPEYSVVIENRMATSIDDANVKFGKFESGGGTMSPGTSGGHRGVRAPVPKMATVEWRTPDGVLHQEEIAVRSRVSRGFSGDLIFTIRNDGEVDFRAETWAAQDAREAERRRKNPPVFEPGELEIDSAKLGGNPYTTGLAKWDHSEIEASIELENSWDVLVELATRIKRDGARYAPGDQVEVEGQMVCFSEGEEGRLLVEPCGE